jgi:oligoribonuclease NrnB/cAMP/cGMP phosphodiesterase (DHH superfamily)
MKVFYHSADLDGHCSGAIVRAKHYNLKSEDVIGINYGDEFPFDIISDRETVYMVDYCLQPFDDMLKLNKICKLIWIDHHKTAIDEAEKRGFFPYQSHLVVGRGACELAWEFCMGAENKIPKGVYLLGRYDVWDLIEGTLEMQNGLRMHDTSPDNQKMWNEFFYDEMFVDATLRVGETLLKKKEMDDKAYSKACAFETEFYLGIKPGYYRCVAINRGLTNSQMFDAVFDPEKHDVMLTFVWRKGQWTVSMYTPMESEIDVGIIAKKYGGGGHVHAAGFQCDKLPFELK